MVLVLGKHREPSPPGSRRINPRAETPGASGSGELEPSSVVRGAIVGMVRSGGPPSASPILRTGGEGAVLRELREIIAATSRQRAA